MAVHVLWATPRTVSTAFERMMIERGDHVVLDEPWSRAYYFGPQRRSSRFPLVFAESTYDSVETGVLAVGHESPVFVKDMAYHAAPAVSDAALAAMTHTFLVRDPRSALASLEREWPDFTDDEAGYAAQQRLFDRVVASTGETPAVIDSDRLLEDPDRVVRAWCGHVGLEHVPASLTWEPGMRPEWQLWHSWYENAAASTGFAQPLRAGASPTVSDRVAEVLPEARAVYDSLRRHAIG